MGAVIRRRVSSVMSTCCYVTSDMLHELRARVRVAISSNPSLWSAAAVLPLWMLRLLKGVGVRGGGGRVVSNSGTWGERSVCLLIKQQQDMCVRVHSPCLPLSGPSLITTQSCVTTLFSMLGSRAWLCVACDDKALCIILPLSHLPDGVLTNGDDS